MSDEHQPRDSLFDDIVEASRAVPRWRSDPDSTPPFPLTNYTLIETVARGGQGIVFKALQRSTNRVVAVKVATHGSFSTESEFSRFQREIEIASSLNHPGIVTIHDGGIVNSTPYIVMEFVAGEPITRSAFKAVDATATHDQIFHTFAEVCRAVGFAHQQGIAHRDLKPSNILVDTDLRPHILDFGMATFLAETRSPLQPRTVSGEFIGTLAYSSPEQLQGRPDSVDARSDVYSLSVILHELLFERLPYPVECSLSEWVHHVTESDSPLLDCPPAEVPPDAVSVLRKGLNKDPTSRYPDATEMGKDLERLLAGEPVQARCSPRRGRHKRNKPRREAKPTWLLSALTISAMIIVGFTLMWFINDGQISWRQPLADSGVPDAASPPNVTSRSFETYLADMKTAEAAISIYDSYDAVIHLDHAPTEHRAFDWRYLLRQADRSERSFGNFNDEWAIGRYGVYQSLDFSPETQWLVSGNAYGYVILWDADTGEELAAIQFEGPVDVVRFRPQTRQIAAALASGQVELLDIISESNQEMALTPAGITLLSKGESVTDLAFSRDGGRVFLASKREDDSGFVQEFDAETGRDTGRFSVQREHPIWCVAVSPDGRLVAVGSDSVTVFDAGSGQPHSAFDFSGEWIFDLTFSPDSQRLACGKYDGVVDILDVVKKRKLQSLFGHSSFVSNSRFLPDGTLVTTGDDRTIRIWNATDYSPVDIKWGHINGCVDVVFNPQNGSLVTASSDCIKTWNVAAPSQHISIGQIRELTQMAVRPDSKTVIVGGSNGRVESIDLDTARAIHRDLQRSQGQPVDGLDISSSGQFVVWIDDDSGFQLFDLVDNAPVKGPAESLDVTVAAFATDDSLLLMTTTGTLRQWTIGEANSEEVATVDWECQRIVSSLDHRWLALYGPKRIAIWDCYQRKFVVSIDAPNGKAFGTSLAVRPDGCQIATTYGDNLIHIWELPTGEPIGELKGHIQPITAIDYSPDSRRLATASYDQTIKLWDVENQASVLSIRDYNGLIRVLRFAPDNNRLIAGLRDQALLFWDAIPESNIRAESDE